MQQITGLNSKEFHSGMSSSDVAHLRARTAYVELDPGSDRTSRAAQAYE